jgi:hypothetical protein
LFEPVGSPFLVAPHGGGIRGSRTYFMWITTTMNSKERIFERCVGVAVIVPVIAELQREGRVRLGRTIGKHNGLLLLLFAILTGTVKVTCSLYICFSHYEFRLGGLRTVVVPYAVVYQIVLRSFFSSFL